MNDIVRRSALGLAFLLLELVLGNSVSLASKKEYPPTSIFQLNQDWTNQKKESISLSTFAGTPFVGAFIFTSCPSTCPMIVSNLKRLDKKLSKAQRQKARYVLFSIDPERDTPDVLAKFARKMNLDSRWTLLTAPENKVRELAVAMEAQYRKDPSEDFIHSTKIYLISAEGVLLSTSNQAEELSAFQNAFKTELKKKNLQ